MMRDKCKADIKSSAKFRPACGRKIDLPAGGLAEAAVPESDGSPGSGPEKTLMWKEVAAGEPEERKDTRKPVDQEWPRVKSARKELGLPRVLFPFLLLLLVAAVAFFAYLEARDIWMSPARVEKVLNADLAAKGFPVSVEVSTERIATIEGSVKNDAERLNVVAEVKKNSSVRDIVDRTITPLPEAPIGEVQPRIAIIAPPQEATSPDPGRIERKINNMLRKNGFANVSILVGPDLRGNVRGYVYSEADKARVLQIARADKNVREVRSLVKVRQLRAETPLDRPVDPARLEGEINRAIRSAGIAEVNVKVNDSLGVTAKGAVRNAYEKQQAMKIVTGFGNVKDVRDLIFIVGS